MAASDAASLTAKTEEFLKSKSIKYTLYNHAAVPTAEEHIKVASAGSFSGDAAKNLFFKDKKGKYFLVVIPAEKQVNLKALAKLIGANGDIRFAQADVLQSHLGVKQGSVTPLGVPLYDTKHEISVVLDATLEKSTLLVHPLTNEATVSIAASDLATLITSHGNEWRVMDLSSVDAAAAPAGEKKETEKKSTEKKPTEKKEKKPAPAKGEKKDDKEKNTMGIEFPKTTRTFANWYQQVVTRSEMIEFYDISGCYILRPWSYSIWESIQTWFDGEIKKLGVKNSYFPLFVSNKALTKEKDHVEGFAAEVAWVTRSGETELDEPIAVRPTSETIMYPAFAKWIRSHRDLPLKLNQWSNVVRWEFKYPTPFIRSREFLWQEGHTAFATQAEADKEVLDILNLYAGVYQDLLAVPVIKGKKTETEKFAGGYYTTTVEAFIPAVGRGVQGATSHCLGQNFAKMFDITFEDEQHQKQRVIQNSWGLTTRTIGVMIMVHGDDKGLVLPPRVAPIQAVIVPIPFTGKEKVVMEPSEEIFKQLKAVGIRIHLDDRDKNPGWKFSDWELRGVPVRLEVGPKDVEKKQVVAVRRDTGAKQEISWSDLPNALPELLKQIQLEMLERARTEMYSRQRKVTGWKEMNHALDARSTALVPHCAVAACEKDIKVRTGQETKTEEEEAEHQEEAGEKLTGAAKSLCIPFDQPELPAGTKCVGCGKDAVNWTLFGRSY